MRSTPVRTADLPADLPVAAVGDLAALPLAMPDPARDPGPRSRRPRNSTRTRGSRPAPQFVHRLGSNALASHGLPAGTSMIIDTERTPQRGDIVFVRLRDRLKVGVLGTQLGRKVLRSDTESFWIDHTTEVWGVAVVADPPLDALF